MRRSWIGFISSLFLLGPAGCGSSSHSTDAGAGPVSTGHVDAGTRPTDGGAPAPNDGAVNLPSPQTTLGGTQLDPKDDGSSGVKSGGSGLVLDGVNAPSTPLIWVANSDDGTISKIDTRAMKELARYETGPGTYPDPSRTTVSLEGDVVVANRTGSSATKIAGDLSRCVDKNGDGKITTSQGPDDLLLWGTDECVLWHVDFQKDTLARAAAFDAQLGPDGEDSSTVWIGLYYAMQMKQLDAKTGKELATVSVAPVQPYGAAIDKDGNVWVRGGGLAKIDGRTHAVTHYAESACGYGIAVDEQGRPWTGGNDCVARFDPKSGQWAQQKIPGAAWNRGIALDGRGSVWLADTDYGVYRVDENTLAVQKQLQLPFKGMIGMAVDFDGMVWLVARDSNMAIKIDPASYKTSTVNVGHGPYTYSDMTGFQLRNATAASGHWHHVFQGCTDPTVTTAWEKLGFTAQLPIGTGLTFKVRSANSMTALQAQPWTDLGAAPPATGPFDLTKLSGGGYLELDVGFSAASGTVTPTLEDVKLWFECPSQIG